MLYRWHSVACLWISFRQFQWISLLYLTMLCQKHGLQGVTWDNHIVINWEGYCSNAGFLKTLHQHLSEGTDIGHKKNPSDPWKQKARMLTITVLSLVHHWVNTWRWLYSRMWHCTVISEKCTHHCENLKSHWMSYCFIFLSLKHEVHNHPSMESVPTHHQPHMK